MKKIYKIIENATNANKENIKTIQIITHNNNQHFDNDITMTNQCNAYFINIGVEMEKMHTTTTPMAPSILIEKSMFLQPVNEYQLSNHISILKNNGTLGKDGIRSSLIKFTHLQLVRPLTHIINLIFSTSQVPSYFKQSDKPNS